MLIDIDTGRTLGVPFKKEFDTLRSRLTHVQFELAVARINELIDNAGKNIVTAGWLPGGDWTGSPFEPLYVDAARRNYDVAARFFGLLVWHTVVERPERWGSGRYEKNGKDIGSRTYFILADQ